MIYSYSNLLNSSKPILVFKLIGTVYNKKTNLPLANAIVTLSRLNSDSLKVETDSTGTFNFNLDKESDYNLNGQKPIYRPDATDLTTKGLYISTTITKDLFLEPAELGKTFLLKNIYYDFDKWNIRADAAIELNKVVTIMKENRQSGLS